jgi:hypothetical protein
MKPGDRRYVSLPQLSEVLDGISLSGGGWGMPVKVARIIPGDETASRHEAMVDLQELKALVYEAVENGRLEGGRLEIEIPDRALKLVGDEEGEFWLEASDADRLL